MFEKKIIRQQGEEIDHGISNVSGLTPTLYSYPHANSEKEPMEQEALNPGNNVNQVYSSASSARAESFFRWVITGTTNRSTAIIRKPREMGRVTKIEKSPCDNIKD